MTKYIIKNCPSYTIEEHCKYNCLGITMSPYCQDCTDCVLKQIVGKCKERTVGFIEESFIKDDILQLLQIEEVE